MKDEAFLRAYVQVYFSGAGLEPKVEQHNAHGRSDLEVSVGERHWVFEFKVSYDGKKEEEPETGHKSHKEKRSPFKKKK